MFSLIVCGMWFVFMVWDFNVLLLYLLSVQFESSFGIIIYAKGTC